MLGKTHRYVGGCCGVIAAEQLLLQNDITINNLMVSGMLVTGSIIGALLLDIDKKGTIIGKKVPTLASILNFLFGHRGATHAPLIWILICSLLIFINNNISNNIRTFIISIYTCSTFYIFIKFLLKKIQRSKKWHSFLGLFLGIVISYHFYTLESVILNCLFIFIVIGIFIGAFSHIILDTFNKMGIPWLYPIIKKKFHIIGLSEKYGFVFSFIFTILTILSTITLYI